MLEGGCALRHLGATGLPVGCEMESLVPQCGRSVI